MWVYMDLAELTTFHWYQQRVGFRLEPAERQGWGGPAVGGS